MINNLVNETGLSSSSESSSWQTPASGQSRKDQNTCNIYTRPIPHHLLNLYKCRHEWYRSSPPGIAVFLMLLERNTIQPKGHFLIFLVSHVRFTCPTVSPHSRWPDKMRVCPFVLLPVFLGIALRHGRAISGDIKLQGGSLTEMDAEF